MSNLSKKLEDLRNEYASGALNENEAFNDPLEQFELWFQQALDTKVQEANAFTLATVGKDGQPSARIVLLKGVSKGGFTFFTNYLSRKAQQMEENDKVAMVFLWPELERQVRVEGIAAKVTEAESDEYFNKRPMGSRLGAWASHQSMVIPNRAYIEQRMAELQAQFGEGEISRPDFWGGYRVVPHLMEFWQGRPSRLHDRLCYERQAGGWKIDRLSP